MLAGRLPWCCFGQCQDPNRNQVESARLAVKDNDQMGNERPATKAVIEKRCRMLGIIAEAAPQRSTEQLMLRFSNRMRSDRVKELADWGVEVRASFHPNFPNLCRSTRRKLRQKRRPATSVPFVE